MVRSSLDDDSPYADAVVHGDGLTSLQYRREKAGLTEQIVLGRQGRRRHAARAPGQPLHDVGRALRRAVRDERPRGAALSATRSTSASSSARTTPRWWRRRSSATCASSSRRRPASRRTATTSAASSRSSTSRPAGGRSCGARRSRSRRRTGRRTAKRSSTTPAAAATAVAGCTASTWRRRSASVIDTGFAIRNNNDHVLSFDGRMLAISDQSQDEGRSTVYTLPTTGGHAEAHHAEDAVVPARLVARRQVAGLHRRPRRRVRHLQDRLGRQRRGDPADRLQGPRRRPGVQPGRQVHLLQLSPQREDAALAHEAGRQGPGAGHERRATTTGSRTSRRTGSRSPSSATATTSLRPSTRTTSTSRCG